VPTGTLQGSFGERGFTFIRLDAESGSEDVFLHVTQIQADEDSRRYVRGSIVEFEAAVVVRDGKERTQARKARLLEHGGGVAQPPTITSSGHRGRVKFWSPLGYGFVVDESSEDDFFAHASSVAKGYLRSGDEVEFDVGTVDERDQAVNVSVVGWSETADPFSDVLDMGSPRWAPVLADIAEPENWNYTERPARDSHPILRSYLKYTFLRLHELGRDYVRVSDDEGHLAFNTGLVTPFQEEIFALFTRRPEGEIGPPWVLKGFEKASSWVFLKEIGGDPPRLAWYFDDPGQLVFDTRLELRVNVEHVPHDPERFPEALKSISPEDLAALVNAKAPEALDRVKRNYKTAIPQFYRDGKSGEGKMQLLLPVALLRRDNVELALAVDRLPSDVYLGRTVLSLDWAYNNARLLTRPDTDWLRP
jgi:cold shock CspA family protein